MIWRPGRGAALDHVTRSLSAPAASEICNVLPPVTLRRGCQFFYLISYYDRYLLILTYLLTRLPVVIFQ